MLVVAVGKDAPSGRGQGFTWELRHSER
jgi:hypothetical protein